MKTTSQPVAVTSASFGPNYSSFAATPFFYTFIAIRKKREEKNELDSIPGFPGRTVRLPFGANSYLASIVLLNCFSCWCF